jgi:hypothetical protein
LGCFPLRGSEGVTIAEVKSEKNQQRKKWKS